MNLGERHKDVKLWICLLAVIILVLGFVYRKVVYNWVFRSSGERITYLYHLGPEKAAVEMKAYLPFDVECHGKTIDKVRFLAEKYEGRVAVDLVNTSSDEGHEEMKKAGFNCATVLINGKNSFTVRKGNKDKEVSFSGPVGFTYDLEDLEKAIVQELKKAGLSVNK